MAADAIGRFPYPIGFDCAGVVTAIGDQVTRIKVGDEVYVRLPEASRGRQLSRFRIGLMKVKLAECVAGSLSEYAKCAEYFVALKPKSLSFGDAASLPLAAMTALQALRKYQESLAGKTVFIPAGCACNVVPVCRGTNC